MPDFKRSLELARRAGIEAELGGEPLEIKQTHISVVLLGRERVLKLKKPVNYGFLDYTTLEKRRAACEAEVRLNGRISPDVYLGVKEIRDEAGQIADCGVLMKRLPADRMLDELVRRDQATDSMIARVACRLAEFHRNARRGPDVDKYGGLDTITANWEENFRQTQPFIGRTISRQVHEQIRERIATALREDSRIFASRIADGHIVDGHGDVRCESVCVVDGLKFFDCIEFNERFRCGDVAGEIAFLAMDLDALGRPDLGYYAAECYERCTADEGLWRLLPFYRCYRAFVRGKVLSFRLDQPETMAADRNRASVRASGYFDLASRYVARLIRPAVIVVTGRSGTGKTSVARGIAAELGLRVVSTDNVREELFGKRKKPAGFGQGVYTDEATQQTYEALVSHGRDVLEREQGVILDGTFLKGRYRAAVSGMARSAGADLRVIECRLAAGEALSRLEKRAGKGDSVSDADWQVYLHQQEEPPDETWLASRLELDTAHPISECSRFAADWLRAREPVSLAAASR